MWSRPRRSKNERAHFPQRLFRCLVFTGVEHVHRGRAPQIRSLDKQIVDTFLEPATLKRPPVEHAVRRDQVRYPSRSGNPRRQRGRCIPETMDVD